MKMKHTLNFSKCLLAATLAFSISSESYAGWLLPDSEAEKKIQYENAQKQLKQKNITDKVIASVTKKLNLFEKQEPGLRSDLNEFLIPGEVQAINRATVDVIKTVMSRAYTGETQGVAKGDHGKSLACLSGSIQFNSNIPENLQRGVVIPNAIYKIESRLSNAEEPGLSDRSSISQGVALKLKSISENVNSARLPDFSNTDEQDFLMTSSPVFFLKDIIEYSEAFAIRANGGGPLAIINGVLKNPTGLGPRLGAMALSKLNDYTALAPRNPENIMTHPYWSKHAYAWGEKNDTRGSHAVKYSVAPCENATALTLKSEKKNYQQEFISEAFSQNGEICFKFRVQSRPVNATEENYPMEDGHTEWLESAAPFVDIAVIKFSADSNPNWKSAAAQKACAATEFTPWNGLLAHQPLSNLARGRRYVYKASALVREMKILLDAEINKAK